MLELLCLHKGTTLHYDLFRRHLFGDDPANWRCRSMIGVQMCKLRKRLAKATEGEHYIETVYGGGYVLRDPK